MNAHALSSSSMPRVVVRVGDITVTEHVRQGHLDAALRVGVRADDVVPDTANVTVQLVMYGVPRFASRSSFAIELAPYRSRSITTRVRDATQTLQPRPGRRLVSPPRAVIGPGAPAIVARLDPIDLERQERILANLEQIAEEIGARRRRNKEKASAVIEVSEIDRAAARAAARMSGWHVRSSR